MRLFKGCDILIGDLELPLLVLVLFLLIVVLFLVRLGLAPGRLCFLADVALIGEDDDTDVGSAVLLDFLEPTVDVVEALLVREVEYDEDAVRTLVVRLRYCSVALLASRVPYLQAHRALVNLQRAESEIHSYGCHVVFLELIVLKSIEK